MKLMKLNIVSVIFNEEKNLPKFFKSLEYIRSKANLNVFLVDQSSQDKSVELSQKFGGQVYIHPNLGYADPDKLRLINNFCPKDERCMILDADEEISKDLADEIIDVIINNQDYGYFVKRHTYIFGMKFFQTLQFRLFKPQTVILTEEIHNYINPADKTKTKVLENPMKEENFKDSGNEIKNLTAKMNDYSEKEIEFLKIKNKFTCVVNIFWKPILWFFGFGIMHRLFLKGVKGFIICTMMAYYQFVIYAKYYEKNY